MLGLPSWLLIVPVLSLIVLVHELGHFATAKWFGITVTEFGFGWPPRMFGVRFRGTLYSINWVPLGGFVRMLGEEDPSEPHSFAKQSVLKRAIVLSAGSFMNIVLPVVIFTALFMLPHDAIVGTVIITGVFDSSPAERAGIRSGDVILSVNGSRIDNHFDLVRLTRARLGREIELAVRRAPLITGLGFSPDAMTVDTVKLVPRLNPPSQEVVEEVTDSGTQISLSDARILDPEKQVGDEVRQGPIGITIGTATRKVVRRSEPIWDAVPMSLGRIWEVLVITKNGIAQWVAGGPDPGLTGPVGIAKVTGEVADVGVAPLFELIALISISLAIVNIMPIPALDGGRLLFVGIEWVRRGRRISPQREGLVHLVGFVILIGLILVMSYLDVVRIISGESFLR